MSLAQSSSAAILMVQQLPEHGRCVLVDESQLILRAGEVYWPASLLKASLDPMTTAVALDVGKDAPLYALSCEIARLSQYEAVLCNPRSLLQSSLPFVFAHAGKALQLAHWIKSHRHCGFCGSRLEAHTVERALQCPECQHRVFPRISPCVIALVRRDTQILLARHVGRGSGNFSCLAGFMEVGETPEETLCREVLEETAITVSNIRYVGSQSWPFPSQLMLGFHADYAGGEIKVDGHEILEARWFDASDLPTALPPPFSVAGQLIALFLQDLKV